MTPTEAVQSILGPMTSPAKVEAVIVAVLEAIREPSDGMVEAGTAALSIWILRADLPEHIAADIFTTMIDHLLEERAKGGGR